MVRRSLAGIRKTRATPPRRVRPLRLVDVHSIVTALRDKADSPQAPFAAKVFERRNSAALLLLLFGALRSDELTRLQIGDVTQEPQSLHLAIRRSKTDQQAVGQVRGLPSRSNHLICRCAPTCGGGKSSSPPTSTATPASCACYAAVLRSPAMSANPTYRPPPIRTGR